MEKMQRWMKWCLVLLLILLLMLTVRNLIKVDCTLTHDPRCVCVKQKTVTIIDTEKGMTTPEDLLKETEPREMVTCEEWEFLG